MIVIKTCRRRGQHSSSALWSQYSSETVFNRDPASTHNVDRIADFQPI